MKKKYFYSLLILMPLLLGFFLAKNTYAYVQLEWSDNGYDTYRLTPSTAPVGSATTTLELQNALFQSNTFMLGNPWLLAPTYYQAVGSKSGNYLSVNADYWFAWQGNGESYINTSRNFMTQANLRCAVGDSLSSYDSTYLPQISNYSVTWQGPYSLGSTSSLIYRVHVRYNYVQQLSSSKGPNVNVYCGWNRNPSDGLFYQGLNLIEANKMLVASQDVETTVSLYSSMTDALLNQQITQNQTIINQNQQVIEQDQQDRDDIESASSSGQENSDASQEQNEQATSTLLSVIGSFIQALGAPASNCQVRTDLGNIDLGTLDFCTGKPNELTPIINTVCAMVMCIPIYLIARDLFRRFVHITTFAQGGEYK